jgi:hypothetical protein
MHPNLEMDAAPGCNPEIPQPPGNPYKNRIAETQIAPRLTLLILNDLIRTGL